MSPPINKTCATYLWPLSVFINLWCIHLSNHRFYIGKFFYWSPWLKTVQTLCLFRFCGWQFLSFWLRNIDLTHISQYRRWEFRPFQHAQDWTVSRRFNAKLTNNIRAFIDGDGSFPIFYVPRSLYEINVLVTQGADPPLPLPQRRQVEIIWTSKYTGCRPPSLLYA